MPAFLFALHTSLDRAGLGLFAGFAFWIGRLVKERDRLRTHGAILVQAVAMAASAVSLPPPDAVNVGESAAFTLTDFFGTNHVSPVHHAGTPPRGMAVALTTAKVMGGWFAAIPGPCFAPVPGNPPVLGGVETDVITGRDLFSRQNQKYHHDGLKQRPAYHIGISLIFTRWHPEGNE